MHNNLEIGQPDLVQLIGDSHGSPSHEILVGACSTAEADPNAALRILVGVCSCRRHPERRQAIRETWLGAKPENIDVRFFVGAGALIPDEPDTVYLDASDDYSHLPSKIGGFYRYALENHKFDYLFKCDDDTYIRLDRLKEIVSPGSGLVGNCFIEERGSPSGGAGYLLSRELVAKLAADPDIPSTGDEDVIFGNAATKTHGVRAIASYRLLHDCARFPRPDNDLITAHWCSPEKMEDIDSHFRATVRAEFLIHSLWEDEVFLYPSGRFCRKSTTCSGAWKEDADHLTLTWDQWEVEIFTLDSADGSFKLTGSIRKGFANKKSVAGPRWLHIGGLLNRLDGWQYLDLKSEETERSFPWQDSSIYGIFLGNVINGLIPQDVLRLLREAHRVLLPGGILRLTFSDCSEAYSSTELENLQCLDGIDNGDGSPESEISASALNNGYAGVWTEESMRAVLTFAGFEEVLRYEPGDSEIPKFQDPELHGARVGENNSRIVDCCLEAAKRMPERFGNFYLVNSKHQWAAVCISKCACTSLKAAVIRDNQLIEAAEWPKSEIHREIGFQASPGRLAPIAGGRLLGYHHFAVWRDPIERFASVIAQFGRDGEPCDALGHLFGASVDAWIDFAEWELEKPTTRQDEHIRRQSDYFADLVIDKLIPLKELNSWYAAQGWGEMPTANSSRSKVGLTATQEERVRKLYEADYSLAERFNSSKHLGPPSHRSECSKPFPDSILSILNPIAIIPAKSVSQRCPGKNLRLIAGVPLFMHSVNYALQEGFTPIVSTDSDDVAAICKSNGVRVVSEVVDDSKMEYCIRQVLGAIECTHFAILQPTSPLRQHGLLRRMFQDMGSNQFNSSFTVQDIKLVGMLDEKFYLAHREQDARRFFRFFDGNILLVSTRFFEKSGGFFEDSSCVYPNRQPCCLQIDTEEEFATLSVLAASSEFRAHLPTDGSKHHRVCIISNKRDLSRDYSKFVEGCDVVIRISKMCNLDTRLTGQRTDVILIACFNRYLEFSREARHVEELHRIPSIYFVSCYPEETQKFTEQEKIRVWNYIPDVPDAKTPRFTTLSKGVALADYLYPQSQLYFLGDCQSELRAPPGKHPYGDENVFIQELIQRGRIIPILEEGIDPRGIYSEPVGLQSRWQNAEACLAYGSDAELTTVLDVVNKNWFDRIRVLGMRARRCKTGCTADIIHRSEVELVLHWDAWGVEMFYADEGGTFRFTT